MGRLHNLDVAGIVGRTGQGLRVQRGRNPLKCWECAYIPWSVVETNSVQCKLQGRELAGPGVLNWPVHAMLLATGDLGRRPWGLHIVEYEVGEAGPVPPALEQTARYHGTVP